MKAFDALSGALAAALLAHTSVASAQSSEEDELALVYGDKSTVSIATGNQQPLRRAPAVATVITTEDIAAMGATDLDEVLEAVPGIHVSRSANSYSSIYVIRGIYSAQNPQVLMLLNGIPMTTTFIGNKGNLWGGYPVEHIARIEIIRGPGSALYGADAYAGVINIITKDAADIAGTEFGARVGSFHGRNAWVQHGGTLGALDVAAFLSVGRTDGFGRIIERDAQSRMDPSISLAPGLVNTGYDSVDGNLDLGYDKWRLRFGYKLRDNLGTGAGITSALDPVGKEKSERVTADLSWTQPQLANNVGAGATASFLYYAQRMPTYLQLFPPGVTFPTGTFADGMIGAPETSERQFRLSAFATYTGLEDHRVRVGVGHDDLNLYDTHEYKNFVFDAAGKPVPAGPVIDYANIAPFMLPQRRQIDYLYAQDEWQFARDWALTAGVRHDRYSDFGGSTNPRLAVVWNAAYDVTAKLLYGTAFRAPSFNEEYSINNPVARGNPSLLPETIKTLEAAFSWQANRDVQLNLSLFRYRMHDIIRTVSTPLALGGTYFNTGSQSGHGMELELAWDISRRLRLSGNYSNQASIDDATGKDAGYAPHHHLYARADWRFASDLLFSTQFNWVADRKRAADDTRPPVPDYRTVDLTLRSNRGQGQWDFVASVRNLFDADVREPSLSVPAVYLPNDLPMAPRAFYLQAIYRM